MGTIYNVTDVKTANYTVDIEADDIVPLDSTGGPFTITLTDPSAVDNGHHVELKDVGGDVEANNVTVVVDGGGNIDLSSTFTMEENKASFTFWTKDGSYHVS